ncbi:hypothetical protein Bbelb_025240 [Branchiostoma belcheri]|nr:hypothetical protein Bbelb_025240 [Branchiostoma belcheri]
MSLFTQVVDQHAPVRKSSVRSTPAQWVDGDLRELMNAKKEAQASGLSSDDEIYKKLRHIVFFTERNNIRALTHVTCKLRQGNLIEPGPGQRKVTSSTSVIQVLLKDD